MLKLQDVRVSYGSIEVLHKINIEVKKGEIVTIIGANGAGKTTTLRSIPGLLPKKRGSQKFFHTNSASKRIPSEAHVVPAYDSR